MLKSELEQQNKELRDEIERLKGLVPLTEDKVKELIRDEILSNLEVKKDWSDKECDLYYDGSYIGNIR